MKSHAGKALRFRHVHLKNWRNFPAVDVDLQDRVFLVGPNASGKSNFLDVFRFLHDITPEGDGFEKAVKRRGGVSSLRCLAARQSTDIVIKVSFGAGEHAPSWEYEIGFTHDSRSQRPLVRKETVKRDGEVLIDRPLPEDIADPKRLTQPHLQQVNVNKEFRDVADFFASVRYLHIVPQLIREPERYLGKSDDPYGGDFLEQIARTPKQQQRARLRRIQEALRVAVPQLKELELKLDPIRGTPHLRGKYEHWRAQGAWQTEESLSDGTLRLLGLLWAIQTGSGPLLLEEPELSLHPEVVRYIPQMLARINKKPGKRGRVSQSAVTLAFKR